MLEIRAASLKWIQHRGQWTRDGFKVVDRFVPMLVASVGDVRLTLRTPFSPLPEPAQRSRYLAALQGQTMTIRPYGLDIWSPKKVMNIEWSDRDELTVVSFHRGVWEGEIIAASRSVGG